MKLTREELAEKVNITPRFCYDLEQGLKGMSLETLCSLKYALHTSTDYLLFGEERDSNRITYINVLIDTCPEEKIDYLIDIIKSYVNAVK